MSLQRKTVAYEFTLLSMNVCSLQDVRTEQLAHCCSFDHLTAAILAKAKKDCQMYYPAPLTISHQLLKFYNFVIINATLQKTHPLRKKA